MMFLLAMATVAEILASPPPPYIQQVSAPTRAAFEASRDKGPEAIIAALDELVAGGDMSAAEFAGEIYGNGAFGVARDVRKACDYFEVAAPHRADSAHNLGTCFYKGDGRLQNIAAAREWYTRASQGGWVKAHCALGNILAAPDGDEADAANGLALCRLAADLGDADAQTDLAGYLLSGIRVPKDAPAARVWLEKAAAQAHPNAAYLLAQVHARGDGTPRDAVLAEQWARKSYVGGRHDAATLVFQAIVSQMLEGVESEADLDRAALPEAIAWGELAASYETDPALRERAARLVVHFKRLQEARGGD